MNAGAVVTLLALGGFHGLNPGMGWLFAVALGIQERDRRAVWRAVGPIAAGHAVAVVAALALADALRAVVSTQAVSWVAAITLIAFGIWRLVARKHPRWVGMRVSAAELGLWSFLMATAHGAGLMVVPVLLRTTPDVAHPPTGLVSGMALSRAGLDIAGAAAVHTVGMLVVMTVVAVLVYERLGLAVLRTAWVNLDLLWGVGLVVAGAFVLFT